MRFNGGVSLFFHFVAFHRCTAGTARGYAEKVDLLRHHGLHGCHGWMWTSAMLATTNDQSLGTRAYGCGSLPRKKAATPLRRDG